jgi:hypothetical protein
MHHRTLITTAVAVLATSLVAAAPAAADPLAEGEGFDLCKPRVLAPGVISTEANESRITFTPDGRTAYFGRSDTPGALEDSTIYVTHRQRGGWSEPEIAPFSSDEYWDLDPFIAPSHGYWPGHKDAYRLYFTSTRPVNGVDRGVNLWYVDQDGSGSWGTPQPMEDVNSEADDLYPSIADDGTLYFNSARPGGHNIFDLYRAEPRPDGSFGAPENLGPELNSAPLQFNPAPLPGGHGLIFASIGRPGTIGEIDLWVTFKTRNGWSEARNLGDPISTANQEFHPAFTPGYRHFTFARYDVNTEVTDLYIMPSWCLLKSY